MNQSYNFDKIATDAKHLDSRYTWTKDDSGLVHFYKRRDYFSVVPILTIGFHESCGYSPIDFVKTLNAFCQTLSELDYAKEKVNQLRQKNKNARRS